MQETSTNTHKSPIAMNFLCSTTQHISSYTSIRNLQGTRTTHTQMQIHTQLFCQIFATLLRLCAYACTCVCASVCWFAYLSLHENASSSECVSPFTLHVTQCVCVCILFSLYIFQPYWILTTSDLYSIIQSDNCLCERNIFHLILFSIGLFYFLSKRFSSRVSIRIAFVLSELHLQ